MIESMIFIYNLNISYSLMAILYKILLCRILLFTLHSQLALLPLHRV